MNPLPPVPTEDEKAVPEFDPEAWALEHGVCPKGGAHEFGLYTFCRRCEIDRDFLVMRSKNNIVYQW